MRKTLPRMHNGLHKGLLTVALLSGALVSPASAVTADYGVYTMQFFDPVSFSGATPPFGTVTVTGDGQLGTGHTATVSYFVGGNFIIDTGGPHQPLAFNLTGGTVGNLVLAVYYGVNQPADGHQCLAVR